MMAARHVLVLSVAILLVGAVALWGHERQPQWAARGDAPASPNPAGAGAGKPTPGRDCYAGSVAEVSYEREILWESVAAVWHRYGWRLSNPAFPATERQITGFAEGSFTSPGGSIMVGARRTPTGTSLTVLVARTTGDRAAHDKQAKEATDVLNRFRAPLESQYGLPPGRVVISVNGCDF